MIECKEAASITKDMLDIDNVTQIQQSLVITSGTSYKERQVHQIRP